MTLAKLTHETRVILKVGGSALAAVILLFLLFQGGSFIQRTFFPAPPAPPEEKFGKLNLEFPQQSFSVPEFRVNTVSGVLPSFESQIKVYALTKKPPTITALPSARQKAAGLGYSQNEQQISPNVYRWSNSAQNSFLLYNIVSLNFSVDSDFLSRGDFTSGAVSDKEDLATSVREFIEALGADSTDIDLTKSSYSYYIASNNELIEVPTASSATFAKVFLIQSPIDNPGRNPYNIYYPTTEPSLLEFTVGNNGSFTIVEANYSHFAPDLSKSSTYAIKTTQEAFEDLKNGKGHILNSADTATVDITDVALGYYLNTEPDQEYLLPIFVFSGKDNFRAYVNALRF